MFNIAHKTILISGGTSGIGLAMTKGLLGEGCSVIATGSRPSIDLEHENLSYIQCDLRQSENIKPMVEQAISIAGGKIGVLICNAGINKDGLAMRMTNDWYDVIQVNLHATFECNKLILAHMMRNKGGRIINISSVVARIGNLGQANYAASKGGIEAMSRCLAIEGGRRNVTVNCVSPGLIDAGMGSALPDEWRTKFTENTALGRIGSPEEVFAAVAFLASDESSYITGHVLHVNGGMPASG